MSDYALIETSPVGAPLESQEATGGRSYLGGRLHAASCDDRDHLQPPTAADMARWRRAVQYPDEVRWGLIDRVRASIERGDYLTENRLDEAASNLARELHH